MIDTNYNKMLKLTFYDFFYCHSIMKFITDEKITISGYLLFTDRDTDVAVAVRAALNCSLSALPPRDAESLADAAN